VKLGVTNAPAGLPVGIQIWPQGRAGPGTSGLQRGEGLIQFPAQTVPTPSRSRPTAECDGRNVEYQCTRAALSGRAINVGAEQFDYCQREGRIPAHGHLPQVNTTIGGIRPVF